MIVLGEEDTATHLREKREKIWTREAFSFALVQRERKSPSKLHHPTEIFVSFSMLHFVFSVVRLECPQRNERSNQQIFFHSKQRQKKTNKMGKHGNDNFDLPILGCREANSSKSFWVGVGR
jgi:hypothetical protein